MAEKSLTARFSMVDEMSEKLARIATKGQQVTSEFEGATRTMDSLLGNTTRSSATTARSVDGVAKSVTSLGTAISASSNAENNLTEAMKQADAAAQAVADTSGVSADAQKELEEASRAAALAMQQLEEAQKTANSAMQHYEDVVSSGTDNLEELKAAEEEASRAAQALEDANQNAASATSRLGDAAGRAAEEAEAAGRKGTESVQEVASVLISVGVAQKVREVGEAFLEAAKDAEVLETSAKKVGTIMDSTETSLEEVERAVFGVSQNTGIARTELNNTVYDTISATSDTVHAVGMVENATKLATAGFAENGNALSILTTILNSYKLKAEEATGVSDSLIMTQNLGVTTVGDLSMQMGKAIATASAYSVNLYNLEAAYIATTKSGIATAESTTYISSMLNELGKADSDVSGMLQEGTGKTFGQLMQEGYSLSDVLGMLYDDVNRDAEAMMNLWGSAEAGKAAAAIINQGLDTFNENLGALEGSAGATQSAYELMAASTGYAHQRLMNSMQLLSDEIGSDLNPALGNLYTAGADAFGWMAEFVSEHPKVSAGLVSVASALGVATTAITGFAMVTQTKLVNALVEIGIAAAANPVFMAATAVAALTAAVVTFAAVADDGSDSMSQLTVASQEQARELEALQNQYDEVVAEEGKNSETALRLQNQISDLSAEYKLSKQTVGEFGEETKNLISANEELIASFNGEMSVADENENSILATIQRLDDYASGVDTSAEATQRAKAAFEALNQTFPNLSFSFEDLSENGETVISTLRRMETANAAQEKYSNALKTLNDLADKNAELTDQRKEATENLAAAQQAMAANSELDVMGNLVNQGAYDAAAAQFFSYQQQIDELTAALEENEDAQRSATEACEEFEKQAAESAQIETGISNIQSILGQMDALSETYDKVYYAALNSIDGQIGLFDSLKTTSDKSVSDMVQSWESQTQYLETYAENIKKAADFGLDKLLIDQLSDGSAKSAGYLNEIITHIEDLGGTAEHMSESASSFVSDFNASFEGVSTAKESFANNVAEMTLDFSNGMNDLQTKLNEAVTSMNKSDDAALAAADTMDSYISSIEGKEGAAVAAARRIASEVAAALKTSASSGTPVTITGHAKGTVRANEDAYIAGEEGPELILDKAGSEVFPAGETQKIISAIAGDTDRVIPTHSTPAAPENPAGSMGSTGGDSEKKFVIEINGNGKFSVGAGTDTETIVAVLQENLKPVLMGMIQEEMLEEGDSSYEY